MKYDSNKRPIKVRREAWQRSAREVLVDKRHVAVQKMNFYTHRGRHAVEAGSCGRRERLWGVNVGATGPVVLPTASALACPPASAMAYATMRNVRRRMRVARPGPECEGHRRCSTRSVRQMQCAFVSGGMVLARARVARSVPRQVTRHKPCQPRSGMVGAELVRRAHT